jgi:hypothetical protein
MPERNPPVAKVTADYSKKVGCKDGKSIEKRRIAWEQHAYQFSK